MVGQNLGPNGSIYWGKTVNLLGQMGQNLGSKLSKSWGPVIEYIYRGLYRVFYKVFYRGAELCQKRKKIYSVS